MKFKIQINDGGWYDLRADDGDGQGYKILVFDTEAEGNAEAEKYAADLLTRTDVLAPKRRRGTESRVVPESTPAEWTPSDDGLASLGEAADSGLVSYHITGDHPTREISPQDRELHQRIFQVGFQRGFERLLVNVYSDTCTETDAEEAAIEFLQKKSPKSLKPNIDDEEITVRRLAEAREVFTPGDRVQVAGGSGLDSDKTGTVVASSSVKTDGRGIPEIEGHYKPADWKREVAVKLDDGRVITMFKNRLSKVSAGGGNRLRRVPVDPDLAADLASKGYQVESGEEELSADALLAAPATDGATVKVEITGNPAAVQRAISKLSKKKKVQEMSGDLPPLENELDSFTAAYIETMLGMEEEFGEKRIRDIAPQTLKSIVADCKKFQDDNREALEAGTEELAGHDFCLTRSGAGAGFWDGDWPEPQSTQLTDAAHAFGQADMYIGDDGLIYQTGKEGDWQLRSVRPLNAAGGLIDNVAVRDTDDAPADATAEVDDEDEETFTSESTLQAEAAKLVDRLLEDDEELEVEVGEEAEEPTDEEAEKAQAYQDMLADIREGDCVTINDKDEVFFGRKFLGRINYSLPDRESKKSGGLFTQSARREGDDFRNDAEAFKAIKLEMDRRKYWPNIYRENDHGNISQLDARGNEINAWV